MFGTNFIPVIAITQIFFVSLQAKQHFVYFFNNKIAKILMISKNKYTVLTLHYYLQAANGKLKF